MSKNNHGKGELNKQEKHALSARTTRRNLITSAVSGATIIAGGAIVRAEDAEGEDVKPCCGGGGGSDYPLLLKSEYDSDSSEASNETIEQRDRAYVYEAISPYNDYWDIPVEFVTHAFCHKTDSNEVDRAIETSNITISSSDTIYSNATEQYVGGCTNEDPLTGEYDWAEDVISLAIGQLPIPELLQEPLQIIASLALDHLDKTSDTNYMRRFDWIHDEYGSRTPARQQAIFWNRAIAKGLSSGETATMDIDSWTKGDWTVPGTEWNMWVQNEFSITVTAPSYSPSDALAMTKQERETRGISTVSLEEFKGQQKGLGLSNLNPEPSLQERNLVKAPIKISIDKN